MKVDVILPAGGRINGDFAAATGITVKALLPLSRKTVLEHTIDVLKATDHVERIVVIGPEELQTASHEANALLPEGESGPENIFRGLQWLHDQNQGKHADRVLIMTTDLPFITADAITSFIDVCPRDADVCLPVIAKQEFEATFPGLSGEYVRLRDGEMTLGCAFLVNPVAVARNRVHIDRVFEARKSQLTMARLLGPLFILRFACGRLTVAHIRERCEKLLGCSGAAILGCAPELAFDIDLPAEYEYARQRLHLISQL